MQKRPARSSMPDCQNTKVTRTDATIYRQTHQRPAPTCAVPLLSGALAGMSVEGLLFPLDCLKTRAQFQQGLRSVGLYRGVGTAIAGAAPASAVFFTVYEATKNVLEPHAGPNGTCGFSAVMLASVLGELSACFVRTPTDLMKQRLQAGCVNTFSDAARGLISTMQCSSVLGASFRATALRDVLHSGLQFPMYEAWKYAVARRTGRSTAELPVWQSAMCGSVAGSTAAIVTTPCDVLKTRLNLIGCAAADPQAATSQSCTTLVAKELHSILQTQGVKGLFAGAIYRASWMGLGGFIFLGAFELAKANLTDAAMLQRDPSRSSIGVSESCRIHMPAPLDNHGPVAV